MLKILFLVVPKYKSRIPFIFVVISQKTRLHKLMERGYSILVLILTFLLTFYISLWLILCLLKHYEFDTYIFYNMFVVCAFVCYFQSRASKRSLWRRAKYELPLVFLLNKLLFYSSSSKSLNLGISFCLVITSHFVFIWIFIFTVLNKHDKHEIWYYIKHTLIYYKEHNNTI